MSDTKKIEESAFACASENGHQAGMTLRDYFAGQFAVYLIEASVTGEVDDYDRHQVASDSYLFADAMMAERSKGQPK